MMGLMRIVFAMSLSASAATAETDLSFLMDRCLVPLTTGADFDTDGLVETDPTELGRSPEAMLGQMPVMWVDAETERLLTTFASMGIRACGIFNATDLVQDDLSATAQDIGLSVPDNCRDLQGDNMSTASIFQSEMPTADGMYITAGFVRHADGLSEVISWTTPAASFTAGCEGQ